MSSTYQPSMLDLMDGPATGLEPLAGAARHHLTAGAWVDVLPGWLRGSDAVFETLLGIDWRADRRQMYDNVVDVPRLLRWFGADEPLPHPAVAEAKAALNRHYAGELGEEFVTAGMCLYRDGKDSVAWHGDTTARDMDEPTLVATVSLGEPRRFLLRPRGGGRTIPFSLGRGDLFVMGGACQRTWQHAVPKVARALPRLAVMFRPIWREPV